MLFSPGMPPPRESWEFVESPAFQAFNGRGDDASAGIHIMLLWVVLLATIAAKRLRSPAMTFTLIPLCIPRLA